MNSKEELSETIPSYFLGRPERDMVELTFTNAVKSFSFIIKLNNFINDGNIKFT